jgi:DNA-binding NarL/FixJ family response regulator
LRWQRFAAFSDFALATKMSLLTEKGDSATFSLSASFRPRKSLFVHPPQSRTPNAASAPKANAPRKIVILDDHPLFREGLAQFINRQKGLACCASVGSSAEAMKVIPRDNPDLVIVDLRLNREDGLQVIKTIKLQFPELAVLVLSQFSEETYGERALRAGAAGYVMKEEATEEVLEAIRTVLRGEIYASRTLAFSALRKLIREKPSQAGPGPDRLSDRELQVFEMIGQGKTTKDIAADLSLSPKTVETYRENIKHKLGLSGGAELTQAAAAWTRSSMPNAPRHSRENLSKAAPPLERHDQETSP